MHRFRVKFLPPTDMLYAFRLDVIEEMSVPDVNCIDINDAIEYNEIHKYFETGVCLKGWTDDDFSRYHRISDSLYGLAQQFFQRLNNQNIIDHYHMVDISYRSRFWDCFCACKLHNSISPNVFDQLMQTGHVNGNGNDVFRHKELVRTYGNVLKQFMMDNEIGVSLLIDEYEHKKGLFIPDELKPEEKIDCIEKYIDSPDPNTNTLLAIYHMHSTRKLPVKDSLRLKAKRRYEERVEELSKKAVVITHDIHLILADNQIEEKVMNQSNHTMTLSYSRKWLDETLDYPSILNNFIYIFEFADYRQMRWSLVSLESEIGVLERVFTQNQSALYYPDGDVFRNKNQIAHMQINAYYKYLLSHNIRLEEVLEWFYSEYLQTEFGCPEMKIKSLS